MDQTTTLLLVGVAAVALLAGIYLVTRPPPSSDVSWEQAIDLGAKIASYYYGVGV